MQNIYNSVNEIVGLVSGILTIIVLTTTIIKSIRLKKSKTRIHFYYITTIVLLLITLVFLLKPFHIKCPDEKVELIINPVYKNDEFISGTVSTKSDIPLNKYKVVIYFQYSGPDMWIHPGKNVYADILSSGEWKLKMGTTSKNPNYIFAYFIPRHKIVPELINNRNFNRLDYCLSAVTNFVNQ